MLTTFKRRKVVIEFIGEWYWAVLLVIIVVSSFSLLSFVVFEAVRNYTIAKRRDKKTRPAVLRRWRKMKKSAEERKKQKEREHKKLAHERLLRIRQIRGKKPNEG